MNCVRPSWDEYFIKIAKLTSERSNCIKRKVGCLIVKDFRILSLGYNGTPSGVKNCYEGGCYRCSHQKNKSTTGKDLHLCICLHAEENAILFISQNNIKDSTIYITLFPCLGCIKKILQCKIKRIVYVDDYDEETEIFSKKILTENNIIYEKFET
jgi:dCMP deaminase